MKNLSWMSRSVRHIGLALLVGLAAILLGSVDARGQNALRHTRIGGYAEDITAVASGPLKDNLVMIDGYEVMSVPIPKNKERSREPLTSRFSLKIAELDLLPTGLTYIEPEGLFAFASDTNFKTLYLFDSAGIFKGTRNIQYLNSAYTPGHLEGMAYIPTTSPTFPDHLMMVVWDDFVRIEVMRRDGVVVAEIFNPAWPTSFFDNGLGDVTYLSPNRLLVSVYGDGLYTMDFSGTVQSGPLVTEAGVGEGIVQLKDGRIVAANFPQSLLYFDSNLNRQPESDRADVVGLNLNTPNGVAWNPDTNQLLVAHDIATGNTPPGIASVPTSLDSATPAVNLSAFPLGRRLSYLPGEHLIAMTHSGTLPGLPRGILLFNANSTFNSNIDLSSTALGQNLGVPTAITFIPRTNEFVLSFNGAGPLPIRSMIQRTLYVISRTGGPPVRTLDLTSTGTGSISGLAYYVDANGNERFVVLGSAGRVIITDFDGNPRNANGQLLGEFNNRVKLGLLSRADIAAITSGPLAGAFAVVDSRGSEIVIFRFD